MIWLVAFGLAVAAWFVLAVVADHISSLQARVQDWLPAPGTGRHRGLPGGEQR